MLQAMTLAITIFTLLQCHFISQYHLHEESTSNPSYISTPTSDIDYPPVPPTAQIRFDWTHLSLTSSLAQRMARHQANCDLPVAHFWYRNRFGLGSDLHVWSQGLCNAMEKNVRLHTVAHWIWWDTDACATTTLSNNDASSPMQCYFPHVETTCAMDRTHDWHWNMTRGRGRLQPDCKHMLSEYNVSEFRAATTEYLFSGVSSTVQREAERQLRKLFPQGIVPHDMITVHIRWGDKEDEATLIPIEEYISAVKNILHYRGRPSDKAHVFLATEDPRAVQQFLTAAPAGWNVYNDVYYQELHAYRKGEYNGNAHMSADLHGKPGLVALGSLLVAMESNDFVLTTMSNWSRLMNELRTHILDPRCSHCTHMIDLSYGEW
jgi:hypothetical protein